MQPPQSIEEIKAGLETTEKGGVRQSIRNCLTVFQRDPLLSGAIAYNILTDRKDIIKPIGFHRESTALNDTDMKYLLLYLEETYGLTNEKKIDNAIGIVANENKYHPIRDYLSALVWDGTERIRFCLRHFLGADADDYTYEALKLFLLGGRGGVLPSHFGQKKSRRPFSDFLLGVPLCGRRVFNCKSSGQVDPM